jgi:hypothetical protein
MVDGLYSSGEGPGFNSQLIQIFLHFFLPLRKKASTVYETPFLCDSMFHLAQVYRARTLGTSAKETSYLLRLAHSQARRDGTATRS